jgi:uncharacterized protein
MKKAFFGILILIIILALPLIFKSREYKHLEGPQLSDLNYTEVFYENEKEGIKLGGMLFVPENGNEIPVVSIIHGSGTSRRNSVWYLSVTKHLLDNGIAVLLPDKRGCEKSEGNWKGVKLEDLGNDVLASVEFIKHQNVFEISEIGILGMSQGGWIAPVAASKSDDISFVINMSGAMVSPTEQLLHEEINNISPYTYRFLARMIAPISVKSIKRSQLFSPFVSFNPVSYWQKVQVPVFIAYGENDKNVPIDNCLEILKQPDFNHYKTKVYPTGGHGIINPETQKLNEKYLEDLVNFIKQH